MYKVLIIDDEITIRKGLRKVIDWEYYGFQVFAEASTAEEGLLIINKLSPDLVMLDMKLSQSTGIDFAREARLSGWKGKIIILSGHNRFEFAQQAIKNEVVDYLLKPVSREKLVEAILQAKQQIEESSYSDFMSQQSITKLRSHILQGLLTGTFKYSESLKNTYNLDLTEGPYQILCIYSKNCVNKDYWESVSKQLGCYIVYEEDTIYIILKGKKSQFYIQTIKKNNDEIYLYSEKTNNISDIHHLYNQCHDGIKNIFFLKKETNEIIINSAKNTTKSNLTDKEIASQICQYITIGDENKLKDFFNVIYIQLKENLPNISSTIFSMLQIYSLVLKELEKNDKQVCAYLMSYDEFYSKLSYNSLFDDLKIMFNEFYDASSYYRSISSQNIIEKVKLYVEENYWKTNLKLESISIIFGYNSAYLGKLFSKENGVNFNTYLDNIRLEKSIELLKTDKKIYQIAEECGFSNAEYFTKKFKKFFNMLPTEYIKNLNKD